jgi:pimeloyl-ACP methyl ester carboxylesterase
LRDQSGYADIGQLRPFYEIRGTGSPLLLLHGSLMTADLMGDFVRPLARARRVIAVELQGHGRTRDIDRLLRYEWLADDVAAVLDYLDLEHADIFGYSTGAAVALQVAMRHPDRTQRVVAASVSYRSDGLHPAVSAQAEGEPEMLRALDGSVYHRAYRAVAPDPAAWPRLVERVFELDRQPQDWPATSVAAIEAPVMLIAADNDIVRLEHIVELYHLLGGGVAGDLHGVPQSWLSVVPGTTHAGLIARASWLVPLIDTFLAQEFRTDHAT